ncbi:MAG: prephenate dehydrogenase, partial [Elusimicrobia bacterium]|nr:prephenate dehydrogenase [Elusimicrobiota bacterium]
QTVSILGVGMMGGSLGLALAKRGSPYRVVGIGRNPDRLKKAKRLGACHAVTTNLEEGVRDADIIVLCTTVSEILPHARKIAPFLKSGSVVTDIGGVKAPILRGITEFWESSSHYVGGHPLAGSEKTGIDHSSRSLYQGATVVLCPSGDVPDFSLRRLRNLWRFAGARAVLMDPDVHDILVAQTSHLPHVLAAGLVQIVARLQRQDPNCSDLLAGSFKDMTRIADSDTNQWSEICQFNSKYVLGALKSYGDVLTQLARRLESSKNPFSEWQEFFSSAKKERKDLL